MKTENPVVVPAALLLPDLNRVPSKVRRIHLMGICGTGMASLAGILKELGFTVTGSDQNVYPPMSIFLRDLGIPVLEGYGPGNLDPEPDLVVVGNVITRVNPEAMELARRGIHYVSLPQALGAFAMAGKRSIVISGTHGKTTTSSLSAWLLEEAGMDPGFMIGGIPLNFSANFKLGRGTHFVIEGDEYDTAFFDKGPKFLHYAPRITILTSIEFDHADIYRDLDHVLESFRKLIRLIPPDGLLIANGDDPLVVRESRGAACRVTTYGFGEAARFRALVLGAGNGLTHLKIFRGGEEYLTLSTPLYGLHNISNLLSTAVLSDFLGIEPSVFSRAAMEFKGIRRRQEIRGERAGITVIDDFAHHPTAVRETVRAVGERFPGRRLIAVFEPRSNSSRRNIFQKEYALSFDGADLVMIPEPPLMEKIPPGERFSSPRLVEDLNRRGLEAFYCPGTDRLLHEIVSRSRKGDVILVMSNGGFDNLIDRLLERMENQGTSEGEIPGTPDRMRRGS